MNEFGESRKKLAWWKVLLIVLASIFGLILVSSSIIAIASKVSYDALEVAISNVKPVEYDSEIILPLLDESTGKAALDENGHFTIRDDKGILDSRNLRILHLTDIHIGGGAFSARTDAWTIRTVEDLVRREKPDFVVVTGDIAYPVPFQAGTMSNKRGLVAFANLMENLGVYWACVFGNHDSEAYSYYNRVEASNFLMDPKYKHCVFDNSIKKLADGTPIHGITNYVINIKNKDNELFHTLFMLDSNSYLPEDPVGLLWKYDKIHDNQLEWYEEQSDLLGIPNSATAKSTMYFHIPSKVFVDIVTEWNKNEADTAQIELRDGVMGEYVAGGTKVSNNMYDSLTTHGTTGIFCGHDHKNNASFWYNKDGFESDSLGLKFTYGMSIDYLAYSGIYKETEQRGGRMIELNTVDKLTISDESSAMKYPASDFNDDKKLGFYTYRIPYWSNLYKDSKK